MNTNEIKKIISDQKGHDELIEIFRHQIDDVSFLANVHDVSDTLVLTDNVGDFSLNGYRIFRLKDITDIILADKNDSLGFLNKVYKKESLYDTSSVEIQLRDWKDVFTYINIKNIPVTVECAYDDAIDYYFGWVKSLSGNIATMICFDGAGELFADEMKINLDFVSQVFLFEKYTTTMAKYINKK